MSRRGPRLVLGVTTDASLVLMAGLPTFLTDQGWEVHVVSGPGRELDSLAAQRFNTHQIPMVRNPSIFRDIRALLSWIKLLKEIEPDAVMVGTPKAGLLGLVAAFLTGVPVRVYHVRGLRLETTTGLARGIYALLEKLAFATSTSALAVSESLRRRLIDLGLVPNERVTVLGHGSSNGVDPDRFSPHVEADCPSQITDLPEIQPGIPVIGYVGRVNRDKGLDTLAAACERLAEKSINYQLLIIGRADGPGSNDILERLSDAPRRPIITGRVDDTAPYYQLMDVLCLPTYREGFPNVVLEASASGLPVVTTDATGAVDSVIPNVTGLIVPIGDSDALADALKAILSDSQLRSKMGRRGREFAVTEFSRPLVWARTESYLRDLVMQAAANSSDQTAARRQHE